MHVISTTSPVASKYNLANSGGKCFLALINKLWSLLKISVGRDRPSLVLNVQSKMADNCKFSTREGRSLPTEIFCKDPDLLIKTKKHMPPKIARFCENIRFGHRNMRMYVNKVLYTSIPRSCFPRIHIS